MLEFDGQIFADGYESDPRVHNFDNTLDKTQARQLFLQGRALNFPFSRYTLCRTSMFFPTQVIKASTNGPSPLKITSQSIDFNELSFLDLNNRSIDWPQFLSDTYVDGLAICHRGELVYESYAGALNAGTPHLSFSLTKSVFMSVFGLLMLEHQLKPADLITRYLPELNHSGFANATLLDVLDMRMAIEFDEDPLNPHSEASQYAQVCNMQPYPVGVARRSIREFIQSLTANGSHGGSFRYLSIYTEVLNWIAEKLTGQSIHQLLNQLLWQPMGAEYDAHLIVDDNNVGVCGAGLALTLRDALRFAELIRQEGAVGSRQIIPAQVVADIRTGGDVNAFNSADYPLLPGYQYHHQWWITPPAVGAIEGRGIFGQRFFVDFKNQLTIVRLASHPKASSSFNDPITIPAFKAISHRLQSFKFRRE